MNPSDLTPAGLVAAGLVELFAEVRRAHPRYPLAQFREAVTRAVGMQSRIDLAVLADREGRMVGGNGDETPVETWLPRPSADSHRDGANS